MGIVAEVRWRLMLELGWRVRAEGSLFARGAGDRGLCVAIASIVRVGVGGIPGWRDWSAMRYRCRHCCLQHRCRA
jgi:hypothetical protein